MRLYPVTSQGRTDTWKGIIDAHSVRSGDFTQPRILPWASKRHEQVWLTPAGARAFDEISKQWGLDNVGPNMNEHWLERGVSDHWTFQRDPADWSTRIFPDRRAKNEMHKGTPDNSVSSNENGVFGTVMTVIKGQKL
jgi:hypothetical protein